MQIPINGIHLEVDIHGEGQPLILIHGVGGTHRQLDIIAGPLSKDYRVIAMDCRGHGASDKPAAYNLTDHANDVLGIMDYFQLERVYLLGVSMGSYIAQQVAFTAPERIKKLILTVPKSNGLISSLNRIIREHNYDFIGLSHHEITLKLLPHLVYNQKLMLEHLDALDSDLTTAEFAAAGKALEGFDFRNQLPAITARTLIISGKYDQLNPPVEGRLCASLIPGARFIEMPYSGHMPVYEEAADYLKIVTAFLK